jgi:hypothetical protein
MTFSATTAIPAIMNDSQPVAINMAAYVRKSSSLYMIQTYVLLPVSTPPHCTESTSPLLAIYTPS